MILINKHILCVIVCVSISIGQIKAQDLSTLFLYQLNGYNVNPARTGQAEGVQAILNPGSQWVGLSGHPKNSMMGVHTAFKDNMGIGGKMILDNRNIFSNFSIEATYSYSIKFDEIQKLSFGVNTGFFQTRLNTNTANSAYNDLTDPNLSTEYYNNSSLLAGAGLLYQRKNLEIAISNPYMIVSGESLSDHFFMYSHYMFSFDMQKIDIQPHLMYQSLSGGPNVLDLGSKFTYDKFLWTQLTYKTNKMVTMALGASYNEMSVGYAYSMTQAPISAVTSGSHELILTYTFKKKRRISEKNKTLIPNSGELNLSVLKMSLLEIENTTLVEELDSIHKELTILVEKQKQKTLSELDEKRIMELEVRIIQMREELGIINKNKYELND
jgi:type IX secretion system PorP/SprF family membrane protein